MLTLLRIHILTVAQLGRDCLSTYRWEGGTRTNGLYEDGEGEQRTCTIRSVINEASPNFKKMQAPRGEHLKKSNALSFSLPLFTFICFLLKVYLGREERTDRIIRKCSFRF